MSNNSQHTLRTAGWKRDEPLALAFPPDWEVTAFWPDTPPPLAQRQLAEALERPIGQPAIREQCRGKKRPLVMVDDLVRPTPASVVMPLLLRHFAEAGIAAADVTVLVATGTHAAPSREGVLRKVGAEAAATCRVLVHDHQAAPVKIGTTSFRTPVLADRAVAESDFLVGIAGVYPNYSAGFGGGSKLALGVLGTRSITHLHYKHSHPGWGAAAGELSFRRDLDEIARMIGLNTIITLHVDSDRNPVAVFCGDHAAYYPEALALSRRWYAAPPPGDADVVISNAYPADSTLTFACMKGAGPARQAGPDASRIVLASCSDGIGGHGLFPVVKPPSTLQQRWRQLSVRRWKEIAGMAARRLRRVTRRARPGTSARQPSHPIWLYQTDPESPDLPPPRGFHITRSWQQIVENVRREQRGKDRLQVFVYPCAAVQFLDPALHVPQVSEALTGAHRKE